MKDNKESHNEQLKRDEQWNEIASRFFEQFCHPTPNTEEYYQTDCRPALPFDVFDFSASTQVEWRNVMSRYSDLYERVDAT
ncbi:hypothetical protein P4B35_17520 [Pontiellaceae bacterium B12227]|nr:hypothetical protein [Pontiellaceae bacterium B12227]